MANFIPNTRKIFFQLIQCQSEPVVHVNIALNQSRHPFLDDPRVDPSISAADSIPTTEDLACAGSEK
jgi:hypothetical protein